MLVSRSGRSLWKIIHRMQSYPICHYSTDKYLKLTKSYLRPRNIYYLLGYFSIVSVPFMNHFCQCLQHVSVSFQLVQNSKFYSIEVTYFIGCRYFIIDRSGEKKTQTCLGTFNRFSSQYFHLNFQFFISINNYFEQNMITPCPYCFICDCDCKRHPSKEKRANANNVVITHNLLFLKLL